MMSETLANGRSDAPSPTSHGLGMGVRYATIAGPVRVDFGFRVYDPADVAGHQWITQKQFYKETLGKLRSSFWYRSCLSRDS